jgi:predicted DCC family thiol-disulfide oxidoreductase YuxK
MKSLTIFYDDGCAMCVRCRAWIEGQPTMIPVQFVSCHSTAALTLRACGIEAVGRELVVTDDDGNVWIGSDAFIVCLWALAEYRDLAITLSDGIPGWLATKFFGIVERHRRWIGTTFLEVTCEGDACGLPPYRLGR